MRGERKPSRSEEGGGSFDLQPGAERGREEGRCDNLARLKGLRCKDVVSLGLWINTYILENGLCFFLLKKGMKKETRTSLLFSRIFRFVFPPPMKVTVFLVYLDSEIGG